MHIRYVVLRCDTLTAEVSGSWGMSPPQDWTNVASVTVVRHATHVDADALAKQTLDAQIAMAEAVKTQAMAGAQIAMARMGLFN